MRSPGLFRAVVLLIVAAEPVRPIIGDGQAVERMVVVR
jgi:hypothetical protein